MRNQDYEILNWIIVGEEYLKSASDLLDVSLKNEITTVNRPTALLFGYFLENLTKAGIIKYKNLSESKSRDHISSKFLLEVGYKVSESDKNMIEFLNEVVFWGKYPKKNEGNLGKMIVKRRSQEILMVFQNQTFYFSSPENFGSLINFSFQFIDYVKQIILENASEEFKHPLHETLNRLKNLLDRILVKTNLMKNEHMTKN